MKCHGDLTDREKFILYCRYLEGMSLQKTGEMLRVSRERVRQLEAKALRKLRTTKAVAPGEKENPLLTEVVMTTRAYNCLRRLWFKRGENGDKVKGRTLADLAEYSEDDLLRVDNCGGVTVRELSNLLNKYGFKLNKGG